MIESSSDAVVDSTIDRAVPAGKTMTIVLGSAPCSMVSFRGSDARGAAEGEAMGFVEGCAAVTGAVCDLSPDVGITIAVVSGMLMKRTYKTTNAITKDRHSATPIVGVESLREPTR